MINKHRFSSLKHAIDANSFYSLPFDEILVLIGIEYPQELDRLKTAYSIKPDRKEQLSNTPSPSQILFGVDYDEVNRTLVSMSALLWIKKRDYDAFVGQQAPETRLSVSSFHWIVSIFEQIVETSEDLYAMITSIIINDLGKAPSLAADYLAMTKTDISNTNHDMILYQVIKDCPNLIPAIGRLGQRHRKDLMVGLCLGAELNFGQLAQAENVPACLSGLKIMQGHLQAFNMHFVEQILDVSGAAGHVTHESAMKMTEPVFQSFKVAYDVSKQIIASGLSLREGYDMVLSRKADFLSQAGWSWSVDFDIGDGIDRAIMRLVCMGNTSNAQDAETIFHAFSDGLGHMVRKRLIKGLNTDGSVDQPAVQATYFPEMCHLAKENTVHGSESEKRKALAAVFKYLTRVLDSNRIDGLAKGVSVIERDVRTTLLEPLRSAEFRENPDMLESLDLPRRRIAKLEEPLAGF